MNKILVIGDIYSETQFFVQDIPYENEFSVASSVETLTSSKTITSARILSRLDNSVNFYAKTGEDDEYLKILSDFKKFKINIDSIEQTNADKTGKTVIVTNQKHENSISIYFGANKTVKPSDIQNLESNLKDYQFVYATTSLPLDCLYKLIEICDRKNVPLFLDFPNQQKTVDLKKLKNVDVISPNREEAEAIFDEKIKTVEDAFRVLYLFRQICKGTIILTLDIDGCAIVEKGSDEPTYYKTTPVPSVDNTGSGDILKAVYISEYLKTKNASIAIQRAQLLATRAVRIKGIDNKINTLNLGFNND